MLWAGLEENRRLQDPWDLVLILGSDGGRGDASEGGNGRKADWDALELR